MSEPFIAQIKPAEFNLVRMSLQRKGITGNGANEFLAGKPVTNAADRLKLAGILIAYEKRQIR